MAEGALARWSFRSARSRASLVAPIALLVGLCVALPTTAVGIAPSMVPQLNGRFGGAEGRYGPFDAPGAEAVMAHARQSGVSAAIMCDSSVTVGKGVAARFITADLNSRLSLPLAFRSHGARVPRGNEILLSPSLARRLRVHRGDNVTVDGRPFVVIGMAANPDVLDELRVMGALGNHFPDEQCYALLDGVTRDRADDVVWGSKFTTRQSSAAWWPRSNESLVPVLRYAFVLAGGLLLFLVMLGSSIGFRIVVEHLRPELATLAVLGVGPRRLRRTIRRSAALLGAACAACGAAGGVGLAAVVAPRVAGSTGHAFAGLGVGVPFTVLIVAIAGVSICVSASGPVTDVMVRDVSPAVAEGLITGSCRRRAREACGLCMVTVGVVAVAVFRGRLGMEPVMGAASVVVGTLLVARPVVNGVAAVVARMSRAGRIAAADVPRLRGRAVPGVLLTAMTAGVTAAVCAVVGVVISDEREAPLLRPNQAVVTGADRPAATRLPGDPLLPSAPASRRLTREIRQAQPKAVVESLRVVTPRNAGPSDAFEWVGRMTRLSGDGLKASFNVDARRLYVGTPNLLRSLGVPRASRAVAEADASEAIEVFSGVGAGAGSIPGADGPVAAVRVAGLTTTVAPAALVSPGDATRLGLTREVGLIIVAPNPLSGAQRRMLEHLVDTHGGIVALPPDESGKQAVRLAVTAVGGVVAGLFACLTAWLAYASTRRQRQICRELGVGPTVLARVELYRAGIVAVAGAVLAAPIGVSPLLALQSGVSPPAVSSAAPWIGIVGICVVVVPLVVVSLTARSIARRDEPGKAHCA